MKLFGYRFPIAKYIIEITNPNTPLLAHPDREPPEKVRKGGEERKGSGEEERRGEERKGEG